VVGLLVVIDRYFIIIIIIIIFFFAMNIEVGFSFQTTPCGQGVLKG
jgi:hypothetical protein